MTVFRVGQRVRIKYARTSAGKAGIGKESTVTGTLINGRYSVDIDGFPPPSQYECWVVTPDQLEPISDSNTLVSWESMRDLWVPEHLRAKA